MDVPTVVAVVIGTVLTLALAAGLGLLAYFLVNWYVQAQADRALRLQRQRELYFARLRTLDDLLQLTPTEFEHTVAELMRFWGYRDVRHTGGGGDLAADVVCRTPDGLYAVVVQCKRYAPGNSVTSPEVQQFIGMLAVHHRAHMGIYVTTSTYTKPAVTLGYQHGLRMIDGNQVSTYIQQMNAQRQMAWNMAMAARRR